MKLSSVILPPVKSHTCYLSAYFCQNQELQISSKHKNMTTIDNGGRLLLITYQKTDQYGMVYYGFNGSSQGCEW